MARSRSSLALPLLLALAAMGLGNGARKGGGAVSLPAGNSIVARTCTGGPAWLQERMAALAALGIAGDMARAIVALWGLETANGKAEWNYNVGNVIATAGPHLAYALDSKDGNYWYRGYTSLAEGAAAWLALIRNTHYADCYALLATAPLSEQWVRCLGAKGYYGANADRYVAGWKARLAQLFPAKEQA